MSELKPEGLVGVIQEKEEEGRGRSILAEESACAKVLEFGVIRGGMQESGHTGPEEPC